ncbi:GNAT family N-acetyltransferase [Catenulispora rubra]|uniref:GNAT family N-acetyltransferase n=1 Tax=Catenulispora rubra TaxID=280293 RepID=UPI001892310B|nr:GNAT family N-acetyltransferase [Catenulispora rubra]
MTMSLPSPELETAYAETVEAEMYYVCESGAPAPTKKQLGITTARIGGGVALSMKEDTTGFWSKALGFGATEPVTADLLREVLAFFRDAGTPSATLQIAPSALPVDWPAIAADLGLAEGGEWWKLAAPLDRVEAPGTTRLRVAPVRPEDAEVWGRVVVRGFGMPEDALGPMVAAYVENPGFIPFAVWDGEDIVAGANLFVHGPVASLNSGSTLPSHRGLGAQPALIAARIEAAREAGCEWVVAETGRPQPGTANASLANLERAGLHRLYARRNWRWSNPEVREG